jgi:hypothetical protein
VDTQCVEPVRVDMTSVPGLVFGDAWGYHTELDFEGGTVGVPNLKDMIASKHARIHAPENVT